MAKQFEIFYDLAHSGGSRLFFSNYLPITVDYSIPFEEMVTRGNFFRRHSELNERTLPIIGKGQKKFLAVLLRPGFTISPKEFQLMMKKWDNTKELIGAGIAELLAFRSTFQEEPLNIVATGQSYKDGYLHVFPLIGYYYNRNKPLWVLEFECSSHDIFWDLVVLALKPVD